MYLERFASTRDWVGLKLSLNDDESDNVFEGNFYSGGDAKKPDWKSIELVFHDISKSADWKEYRVAIYRCILSSHWISFQFTTYGHDKTICNATTSRLLGRALHAMNCLNTSISYKWKLYFYFDLVACQRSFVWLQCVCALAMARLPHKW